MPNHDSSLNYFNETHFSLDATEGRSSFFNREALMCELEYSSMKVLGGNAKSSSFVLSI
jgi:hypothetical protein